MRRLPRLLLAPAAAGTDIDRLLSELLGESSGDGGAPTTSTPITMTTTMVRTTAATASRPAPPLPDSFLPPELEQQFSEEADDDDDGTTTTTTTTVHHSRAAPPPLPFFFTVEVLRRHPNCRFDEVLARWQITTEAAATAVTGGQSTAAAAVAAMDLREVQLLNAKLHDALFDHPRPGSAADPHTGGGNGVGAGIAALDAAAAAAAAASDPQMTLTAPRAAGVYGDDGDHGTATATWSARWATTHADAAAVGPRLPNHPIGRDSLSSAIADTSVDVTLFRYYSLVHFAAELDSPALLAFAADELPQGISLCLRPDQQLVMPSDMPMMSVATPMMGGAPEYGRHGNSDGRPHAGTATQPSPVVSHGAAATHRLSFNWIARCCADYAGFFPFHRAATGNATAALAFLVDRFGEQAMLDQRRLPSFLSGAGPAWGADKYTTGRTAVGCAVAVGATETLAWVLERFPHRLALGREELSDALISAALEDTVASFDFFSAKGLFPRPLSSGSGGGAPTTGRDDDDNSHDTATAAAAAIADAVLLEGLPAVLAECGCHSALYAAAESGSGDVIDWYVRTFGEECLWAPDQCGATALHHCARGGNAALLRRLLLLPPVVEGDQQQQRSATTTTDDDDGHYRPHPHVDDCDERGRTAAMWCVQGGKKGRHVTETLQVLEEAGSQWRTARTEDGYTLADIATRYHRPFTKVGRFIRAVKADNKSKRGCGGRLAH